MNELIWFSVPGAIAICAIYLLCPRIGSAPAAVLIGVVPMLGFILHQTYRTFFEAFGGWESPRRSVLASIQAAYRIDQSQRYAAFLIWETTFYSNDIPGLIQRSQSGDVALCHVVPICFLYFWHRSYRAGQHALILEHPPMSHPRARWLPCCQLDVLAKGSPHIRVTGPSGRSCI
jgi:hypothetical protein